MSATSGDACGLRGLVRKLCSEAVWTFDEAGIVTRVEIYRDHQEAEALEAAGLSE